MKVHDASVHTTLNLGAAEPYRKLENTLVVRVDELIARLEDIGAVSELVAALRQAEVGDHI